MKYAIASNRNWIPELHRQVVSRTEGEMAFISNKEDLSIKNSKLAGVEVIFFPHWSHIIPEEIYVNYECIYFSYDRFAIWTRRQPIVDMIVSIILERPEPQPQQGTVTTFKRRKEHESNIESLQSLEQVNDYIRMLDADGYPKAYIETEHIKIEFSRVSQKSDCLLADAIIKLRK